MESTTRPTEDLRAFFRVFFFRRAMERAFSRGILRGRAGQIGKASLRFSARNVQGRNLEAAAYLLFPFLPGFTGFYRVLPSFYRVFTDWGLCVVGQ